MLVVNLCTFIDIIDIIAEVNLRNFSFMYCIIRFQQEWIGHTSR